MDLKIFRYLIVLPLSGYGKMNEVNSNFSYSAQMKHAYVIEYCFFFYLSKASRTDFDQVLIIPTNAKSVGDWRVLGTLEICTEAEAGTLDNNGFSHWALGIPWD